MISAKEFIDLLEHKDLLDPELIDNLRQRVEQSMAPVSAALLAKRLVDKGHLSRKLAQRLLDRATADVPEDVVDDKPPKKVEEVADTGPAPLEDDKDDEQPLVEDVADLDSTEDEDWGLAELDDDPPRRTVPARPVAPAQPVTPVQPAPPVLPIAPLSVAPMVDGLEEIEELDGSLEGLDSMEGDLLEEPLQGGKGKRRGAKKKKGGKGRDQNVWDSKLMLLGGGSLLFLCVLGIILFFVLKGRGADGMIAQADDYYQQGAYTKAIDAYTQFLDKFPKNPAAGGARVRLSLADMRQVVANKDWTQALETAKTEIPLISGEEAFATDARPELASMLPDIAEGLAEKAHTNLDGATADLAEEGLALVEKYILSSSRPQDRLEDIVALIALTRREIVRGERLEATVAEMIKLAAEGETQKGYEQRRALLKDYQILVDDPTLAEAVRIVSSAEQSAVEKVEKSLDAVTEEPETTAVATIGLARRTDGGTVSGGSRKQLFVVAGGAVYGVNVADGKVLWRRDVGFEANVRGPQFPPTPVSERPDADPLLVSRSRQEVLRVEATTGKIRWRFPVGEPFDAHPVVFENNVLVATRSGRLVFLDLETGDSSGHVRIPQPLRVGPTPDGRRGALYQVGEHSSLFMLTTDGSCSDVIYLGHEPGTILVDPVLVNQYLILCENDGVHDAVLKVLDIDPKPSEEGQTAPPPKVVQEVQVKGHIHAKPLVSGDRVLLVTDAGTILVFELTGSADKAPLAKIAEGKTDDDEQADLVRFSYMQSGRAWIADSQLTQYDVRALRGKLNPKWITNEKSVSLQPPVAAGEAVIHVRNRRGMPGVIVSAVDTDRGRPIWETTLAAPAAAAPIVDQNTRTIISTSAVGSVFQLPPPTPGEITLNDQPTGTLSSGDLKQPIVEVVRMPNGLIAMVPAGEPKDIHVFEPGMPAGKSRFRRILLSDPLSGSPAALGEGLLAPCITGSVFLMDPLVGKKIAEPFQPTLQAGRTYHWSRPALYGDDQFVIADDTGGVYRVVMRDQPTKHLAAAATLALSDPLASPIAVLGDRVYAVDRTDSLVQIDLPGLTDPTPRPLGAKCVFGPVTVGSHVLLVTNDDRLHVIDAEGKMRGDALPYGPPAGEPAVEGTLWTFASRDGVVWQVDSATGEEVAKRETNLALGSGVSIFGSRLLVTGHDGTLYLIDKP